MENLVLSFQVVFPLIFMVTLGYGLRRANLFNENTLTQMNKICFRVFLPILLFLNIYNTDLTKIFNIRLISFAVACLAISFLLVFLTVYCCEKENRRRGVLIQSIFRPNFILFGLPVSVALFGSDAAAIASLLSIAVIPMFNVFSVIALEVFRGQRVNIKAILRGVITNPLIIASILGVVFLLGHIHLPDIFKSPLTDLSKIATPLAMVVLGGSFSFASIKAFKKQLIFGAMGRLIIIPFIFLLISVLSGYRNAELVVLMTLFASPTAVSSFTMAQQMGGDSELASSLVVFTSMFSMVTIFMWTYLLKVFGLI